ncbi:uncharacterized protein LOC131067091 isoform X2 [Cryptomeria japonica]|uniref:uncharacterized protein LOC131067091 isoform X2 n=1 Tax=Cryptomeria japonica TaxID=3369 RepID=UPI0027D9F3E7|nr:uncharacterized protein LOC131067091 isoform X2 [Cryptomeria japonica]
MSGGFFRGTSADQDTRFSNKEAKLLKSQKFPAELDQLVDMTKVKMDVIRPWIANRTTEFLGFEDEVLINFIYGLLDGKEVDGKQIQIQLTGFMEKNTVKFMKELWGLLTSAQKNASGIPQQFLDAKAEETRKKKAEADRINYEIQKKKEEDEKEVEQERQKKINADLETAKIAATAVVSTRNSGKDSLKISPEDEMAGERRSSHARGKNGDSRLTHDGDHSPPHRISSSPRSRSQTDSISRSQSRSPPLKRRHRSRSISRSPRHRRRSPSPIRRPRSPMYSPPRRKRSPLYARSPRRRSPSPWRRRLPSPRRRRSPSPPRRRRSPSPPLRKRSPSPPPRRRSPSPRKRRSPSPPPKRSPTPPPKRRSPSPVAKRRSPSPPPRTKLPVARSPVQYRPSPACSPRRRRMDSQSPPRRRKRSPQYRTNRSPSRERDGRYNEVDPRRYRDKNVSDRPRAKRSPDHEYVDREEIEGQRRDHLRAGGRTGVESSAYRQSLPIHPRSPQRDVRMRSGGTSNMPESPPAYLSSPNQRPSPRVLITHMNEEKRRLSPHRRQMGSAREQGSPHENIEPRRKPEHNTRSMVEVSNRRDLQAPHVSERKEYGPRRSGNGRDSPTGLLLNRSGEKRGRQEGSELKRNEYRKYNRDNVDRSPEYPQRRRDSQISYPSEGIEYGPGRLDHGHPLPVYSESRSDVHRPGTVLQSHIEYDDKEDAVGLMRSSSRDSYADDDGNAFKVDAAHKPIIKPEPVKQMDGSDSGENEAYRRKHVEKRKAKREETAGQIIDDDEDGNMSPGSSEERREAKRRKKEEKRLRKEEKRRRREERHRRKEERRASKVKAKAPATVATVERDSAAEESEDDYHDRDHSQQSQDEEMEDEQKRLEIELRRKALESLRAKKAISH